MLPAAASGTAHSASTPPSWTGVRNLCSFAKHHHYVPGADRCSSALTAVVDGNGGTADLVLVYGRSPSADQRWPETLKIVRASGGALTARLAATSPAPAIVAIGNINADPGAEILIYTSWISSGADVAVYSFRADHLVRSAVTLHFDGDSATRAGFDCVRTPKPEIVQRNYELIGPTIYGRWHQTAETYAWNGANLRLVKRSTTIHRGWPHGASVHVGTGCDPLPAYR